MNKGLEFPENFAKTASLQRSSFQVASPKIEAWDKVLQRFRLSYTTRIICACSSDVRVLARCLCGAAEYMTQVSTCSDCPQNLLPYAVEPGKYDSAVVSVVRCINFLSAQHEIPEPERRLFWFSSKFSRLWRKVAAWYSSPLHATTTYVFPHQSSFPLVTWWWLEGNGQIPDKENL